MYVSGFVIPVPEESKEAYRALAAETAGVFRDYGCTEIVEAWEEDVQDGQQTDFRKAVKAEPGEKIVFSWMVWPDKATADAGYAKMMGDGRLNPDDMPFDGRRLVWGGFSSIFTLGRDQ